MEPENFYRELNGKIDEIGRLDLPDYEKEKLYGVAALSIKIYEEVLENTSRSKKSLAELLKSFQKLGEAVENFEGKSAEAKRSLHMLKSRLDVLRKND